MQLKTIRILAGVIGALLLCVGSVTAQMDPGSGTKTPRPNEAKPATTKPPAQPANQKPAAADAEKSPARNAGNAQPTDNSQPAPAVPKDPIIVILEQIAAASTAQDVATLRLKLVDELVRRGDKQEAQNQLRQMLAEDRFDPQSFYNIGNAFARLGDMDAAVVSYRKAIDQKKGRYSKALNNLAVVLMRRGDWDLANQALTTALRLENFRYAEASYNLGRLYAAQGQMDLAIREWHRAVIVDPNHVAAAQALAHAGYEGRITVGTVQPAPEVREPKPSTKDTQPVAPLPRSVRPVLAVDPVTFSLLQHAREAHERGKDQEAIGNYRNVISRMGGYFPPANLELSYILLSLKQPDEALVYLKPVTSKDGTKYPISYYHLARIYEVQGDLGHAAEAYEHTAALYRGINPQFLLDVSRVREKRGEYQAALMAMEEYVKAVEQLGLKPVWSEERLAALRLKASASQAK